MSELNGLNKAKEEGTGEGWIGGMTIIGKIATEEIMIRDMIVEEVDREEGN